MKPEKVHIGTTVRVRERHRIAERRGMVGRIAAHYGGDGYVAVDVRFSGGHRSYSGQRIWRRSPHPNRGGVRCSVGLVWSKYPETQ